MRGEVTFSSEPRIYGFAKNNNPSSTGWPIYENGHVNGGGAFLILLN